VRRWSVRKLLSCEIKAERQADESLSSERSVWNQFGEQLASSSRQSPRPTFVIDSLGALSDRELRGRAIEWVTFDDMSGSALERLRQDEDRRILARMRQAADAVLPPAVTRPPEDELDRRYNEALYALMCGTDPTFHATYGSNAQSGPIIIDAQSGYTLGREAQRQRRELNRALGVTTPPRQADATPIVNPRSTATRATLLGDTHIAAPPTVPTLYEALRNIEYGSSTVIRLQRPRPRSAHEIQFNGHLGRVDPVSLSNAQQ
jgi:hypothetical protein